MSAVLSFKDGVKARKAYRCCLCGEGIGAGDLYDVRRGVNSDGRWTMHMHPECHAEEQRLPWREREWWYEDVSEPLFERPKRADDIMEG